MRSLFYNKLLSILLISFFISLVIGKLILKSNIYFLFSASSLGAIYLLLGWIYYLKLDGVTFFKNKSFKYFKENFSILDRFRYKTKGIYNMDEHFNTYKANEISEKEAYKASMYAYILSGIILLVLVQLVFSFGSL